MPIIFLISIDENNISTIKSSTFLTTSLIMKCYDIVINRIIKYIISILIEYYIWAIRSLMVNVYILFAT